MQRLSHVSICLMLVFSLPLIAAEPERQTSVSIQGEQFQINGRPTYAGRRWNEKKIEGLLFNSRMVQAIFDDLNPETRSRWAYPDTQQWDPDRNTREFLAAMPEWRSYGLLAITLNLQGGSPQGYSSKQPWINSAFTDDGALRPDYMTRLKLVLYRADELGIKYVFDEGTGGGGGGNGGSISGINLTQPLLTDIINPEPPTGCTEGSCS